MRSTLARTFAAASAPSSTRGCAQTTASWTTRQVTRRQCDGEQTWRREVASSAARRKTLAGAWPTVGADARGTHARGGTISGRIHASTSTSRTRAVSAVSATTPRGARRGRGARTMTEARTHVSNLNAAASAELKHWSTTNEAERNDRAATKVFCNRSLNMKRIDAIGFDMDYTLAMYKPETFEMMSYNETVKKLVAEYGYPRALMEKFEFDPNYMVRGLIVDKRRGNILKMDRHNYVKVAYHGFTALDTEERLATYCETSKRQSFDGPEFNALDTLFSMGEAYLFSQLVEAKDSGEHAAFFERKSFIQIFDEIRASVDLCHRDGSLKHAVAADPGKFISKDDGLVPLLKAMRASGKQVFLLTNSLWDYTNVVMNYLVDDNVGDAKTLEWLGLFDVVITGSAKPGFFANDSATIFEVDTATGLLHNTDNGAPLTPIGSVSDVTHKRALASGLRATGKGPAKVYQGGSYTHLHAMLGIEVGSRLLYVGDHIYGDILRAKKEIDWRTMLVVPELAHEIECLERHREKPHALRSLRTVRDALDDQVARHAWLAANANDSSSNEEELETREAVVRHRAHGAPRGHARVPPRVSLRLGTTHEGGVAKFALRVSSRAIRVSVHVSREKSVGLQSREGVQSARGFLSARSRHGLRFPRFQRPPCSTIRPPFRWTERVPPEPPL